MSLEAKEIQENLYKDIAQGKAVLFLGAGASVTDEKIYLSKQLMEYYRDIKNISYQPVNNNIVDFVDKVFSVEKYDRNDFDYQIADWLKNNLKIQDHHKALINIPWLSIISTNVDLLIENAIENEELEDSFQYVRNKEEFSKSSNLGDKKKYIKLHGCVSDISKYPLAFSSTDFLKTEKFYKRLFGVLTGLSPQVKIVFIGYSFNDKFGELFLNKFSEKMKVREYFLVDPYLNDDEFNIQYLKSKQITPIKKSTKDFISEYSLWFNENLEFANKPKNNLFKKNNGTRVPEYLQNKLRPFIIPINNSYGREKIDAKDYYLGEEPNYNVIQSNLDIIKEVKIFEIESEIIKLLDNNDTSYPFVFLKGSFGTGKTTFTYRLIQKLISENDDLLAFEIIDTDKISQKNIIELIKNLNETKKIIFYSNYSELDLNFKRIRELRGYLSAQQFVDKSILFLQSIRENSLEIFKRDLKPIIYEFDIDCNFTDKELNTYLERLNYHQIKTYRSELEKQQIIGDIQTQILLNDQLLLSLFLIANGNHAEVIIDTYKKFQNKNTQKAFLYTAILYQYGIKMPVSLLKEIVDIDWHKFTEEVIRVDGKGVFIQETSKPDGYLKSDLFFKIKHRIIAEKFISSFLKTKDLFGHYKFLISKLPENDTSVITFINLIKSIINNKLFDESKINHLYDIAYNSLGDFVRFNIYYSRNLQFRRNQKSLEKGLYILENSEEENQIIGWRRDPRIIHRKACINNELSKLYFKKDEISNAKQYLDEANELFSIKLATDPSSIFSYKDYVYCLGWYISKWRLSEVEKIKTEIKISNIVEKGIKNLQEGLNDLIKIKNRFINKQWENHLALRERIDNLSDNLETRPFSLLLKFELLKRHPKKSNHINESELIEELEQYSYIEEVSIFLFHYFGEKLNIFEIRMKFFELLRNNQFLIEKEELYFLYYNFIAESYNGRFKDAYDFQRKINFNYKTIKKSPLYWKEQSTNELRVFEGRITKNTRGYYDFKALETGNSLKAKINNKKHNLLKLNNEIIKANLFFTYTGIWAELLIEEE